jgi:hypothetical protein
MMSHLTRRQFLKLSIGTTITGVASMGGGVAHALTVEPRALSLERITIRLARLPRAFDGWRIVQLSDFHHSAYTGDAEVHAAVVAANELRPELILLTGDFVSAVQSNRHADACVRLLAGLRAPAGVFGIMGNHDYWSNGALIRDTMSLYNIPLLLNDAVAIERDGARLWLAGIEDVSLGRHDLARALRNVPHDEVTILLAHEPDFADEAARYPVDLQLSGHSHGGQVRLPLVGPMVLPEYGEKYPMGWYQIGNLQLYTTRGIGMIPPPLRMNCPPEVTEITLRSAQV